MGRRPPQPTRRTASKGRVDVSDDGPVADSTAQAESGPATDTPGPDRIVAPLAGEPFPIVGMGASAGGLEALQEFFAHMPPDSGMAFIVVTHQPPDHTSLMPELLARHTEMPVVSAASGTKVEPNRVYVAPPADNLAILQRTLHLMQVDPQATLRLPIDYFFRSLAQDQRERAIGVVLSGTGTDGTRGLREIKGASGMVMVQAEQSAQYTGMPRSAIATELVDYVLPVGELPKQLIAYAEGPYYARGEPVEAHDAELPAALQQIFVLIRNQTGHDFSSYKPNTIRRRIERRMNVHQIAGLDSYLHFLQLNPAELQVLFKELLIGVTSFFRDPDAFNILASKVLPSLVSGKPKDDLLRVWVPGCSTGEEAYSLAILLRECMESVGKHLSVQIFATDLDPDAIAVARAGLYPNVVAADVAAQRLERFFLGEDGCYRVKKELREMLVFAPQNVIADPPFTKLDLLCCRNLLIYLNSKLQQRILSLFHYALRPEGVLFLGSSESIDGFGQLFTAIDKKWKIFRRQEVMPGTYVAELPLAGLGARTGDSPAPIRSSSEAAGVNLQRMAERVLLDDLVPPTVIVHERGEVVYIHGRTGRYLEPAAGTQTTTNIFNMVRQGLHVALADALRRAEQQAEAVRRGVRVRTEGGVTVTDLKVQRIQHPEALRGLFRVTFEPVPGRSDELSEVSATSEGPPSRTAELEHELQHTKESHQGTVEELAMSNEELRATNEELQSANEELETSKEEMQSLNEELQTVNAELQGKIEQLSRANDDMKNLLNGTDIATIFLDARLCIKRFTAQARRVVRLIPSDTGRPIGDLMSSLRYDGLVDDALEVLSTLVSKEREVQGTDGAWYQLRILPYRTTDNVIEGLVLTFVDITKLKQAQVSQRILQVMREPLVVLDPDLRIVSANEAFYASFRLTPPQVEGRPIYEVGNWQWDLPRLRRLMEKTAAEGSATDSFEIDGGIADVGSHRTVISCLRVDDGAAPRSHVLLAFDDTTGARPGSHGRPGEQTPTDERQATAIIRGDQASGAAQGGE
jgi:two-component system CheB/CheR fusion protein